MSRPVFPSSRARRSPEAGDLIDDIGYRRFVPAEADLLAEFLTTEDWPYHGSAATSAAQIRQQAAAGLYDNDRTRTFWIVTGGTEAGLVRLLDLGDDTPLFDLRIRAACRGQGLGTGALRWLTRYLFTEFPGIRRIEGTTRQDNHGLASRHDHATRMGRRTIRGHQAPALASTIHGLYDQARITG